MLQPNLIFKENMIKFEEESTNNQTDKFFSSLPQNIDKKEYTDLISIETPMNLKQQNFSVNEFKKDSEETIELNEISNSISKSKRILFKEVLRIKVINNFFARDCYQPFIKLRVIIIKKFQDSVIILNGFFELFVNFSILLNTLFLALNHHGMSKELENLLSIGNYVKIF